MHWTIVNIKRRVHNKNPLWNKEWELPIQINIGMYYFYKLEVIIYISGYGQLWYDEYILYYTQLSGMYT